MASSLKEAWGGEGDYGTHYVNGYVRSSNENGKQTHTLSHTCTYTHMHINTQTHTHSHKHTHIAYTVRTD